MLEMQLNAEFNGLQLRYKTIVELQAKALKAICATIADCLSKL